MDEKIPIFINPDETHPVGWVEIGPDAEEVLTDGKHYITHTFVDDKRVVQFNIALRDQWPIPDPHHFPKDAKVKVIETQASPEPQEKVSASGDYAIKPNVALFDRCYVNQFHELISVLFVSNARLEDAIPEVLLTTDAAKKLLEQLRGILDKSKSEQ